MPRWTGRWTGFDSELLVASLKTNQAICCLVCAPGELGLCIFNGVATQYAVIIMKLMSGRFYFISKKLFDSVHSGRLHVDQRQVEGLITDRFDRLPSAVRR